MQGQLSGSAEFDAFAESYDRDVQHSLYGLKPDYFTRVKAAFTLDLVRSHFGAAERVDALDVGCGIGNYHSHVGGHFRSLTGVDVSEESLRRATERNAEVAYHHYDGHRLPFADGSFDLAFTICVMHHVPPAQWPSFADEMKRILRPGGLALVFEHNPANPLTRKIVDRCEFDRDAVLLKRSETETLLRDTGLANVGSRCILTVPSINRQTRALDFALGRLGMGAQYVVRGEVPPRC